MNQAIPLAQTIKSDLQAIMPRANVGCVAEHDNSTRFTIKLMNAHMPQALFDKLVALRTDGDIGLHRNQKVRHTPVPECARADHQCPQGITENNTEYSFLVLNHNLPQLKAAIHEAAQQMVSGARGFQPLGHTGHAATAGSTVRGA